MTFYDHSGMEFKTNFDGENVNFTALLTKRVVKAIRPRVIGWNYGVKDTINHFCTEFIIFYGHESSTNWIFPVYYFS